jgi:hypothetical protein
MCVANISADFVKVMWWVNTTVSTESKNQKRWATAICSLTMSVIRMTLYPAPFLTRSMSVDHNRDVWIVLLMTFVQAAGSVYIVEEDNVGQSSFNQILCVVKHLVIFVNLMIGVNRHLVKGVVIGVQCALVSTKMGPENHCVKMESVDVARWCFMGRMPMRDFVHGCSHLSTRGGTVSVTVVDGLTTILFWNT